MRKLPAVRALLEGRSAGAALGGRLPEARGGMRALQQLADTLPGSERALFMEEIKRFVARHLYIEVPAA